MSNNTDTSDTYHSGLGLVLIMLTIIVFTILVARNLLEQEVRRNNRILAINTILRSRIANTMAARPSL